MPAVQRLVGDLFKKSPSKTVNPDEAVGLGAAVQAGVIKGDIDEVLLLDVTPLSLGVELEGGIFSAIITRNSNIPVTATKRYTTVVDNQSVVKVHVLQGERKRADENRSLAVFRLSEIEPAPQEVPEIEVKFHLDANGILQVSATDLTSGTSKEILVDSYDPVMAENVESIIQDAVAKVDEDKEYINLVQQRLKSQKIHHTINSFLDNYPEELSEDEKRTVKEALIRFDIAIEKQDSESALEQEMILRAFCDKHKLDTITSHF
jgi:molecular chaperone DnaK